MSKSPRHKVFISFHEEDIEYKDRFVRMMKRHVVDKSVEVNDIDDRNIKTETIRQRIRDKFIADATVTIVLIGPCTWQRKHVDWEIGSSLRATKNNSRCGLVGLLLPNHPEYEKRKHNPRLIPPRVADNCKGDDPYAVIHKWPIPWAPVRIRGWIHRAFTRRTGTAPSNARAQFKRNRRGKCSNGWIS